MIYSEISLENTEDKENTENKENFNMNYGFLDTNIMGSTIWIKPLKNIHFEHLKTKQNKNDLISQSVEQLIYILAVKSKELMVFTIFNLD